MKIAFFLGSPDINGGTYVIYEHASRLKQHGHSVSIITEGEILPERYAWHPDASRLEWLTQNQASKLHFDIMLATWWQSPLILHEFRATHYVYFVQSIESRFFGPKDPTDYDLVDHEIWREISEMTYSYTIPVITEAKWIKEYLYNNYNKNPYLVRNGIRKDIYCKYGETIAPRKEGFLRVLVEGPVDVFYKNVPKSINLCRQAEVDEIWLLTSSDVDKVDGVDRLFSRIPIHDTPAIYRSCDILVKLSHIEGMFGPPLEMFHCGGTALVYNVTGHDEYIVNDENSYVVEKDNDVQVVKLLQRLKREPEELKRLKLGAEETAASWPDWDVSSRLFNNALQDIAKYEKCSSAYLKKHTELLFDNVKPVIKARTLDNFSEREEKSGDNSENPHNFAHLYWQSGEQFSTDRCKWCHYYTGDWQTISFEVAITGFPFWLRVDPSVRIGIILIESIVVNNDTKDELVMTFQGIDEFGLLYLDGSVCRLDHVNYFTLLSYGDDPQAILPAVEKGDIGDILTVEIRLKEIGIRQFHDKYYLQEIWGRVYKNLLSSPRRLARKIKLLLSN